MDLTRQDARAVKYRLDSDFGGLALHKLRGLPIVSRTAARATVLASALAAIGTEVNLVNVTVAQATALLAGVDDYQDAAIVSGYRTQMEGGTWPTTGTSDLLIFADYASHYPGIDDAMLFVDGKHRLRALAGARGGTRADFKVKFINARDVLLHSSGANVG